MTNTWARNNHLGGLYQTIQDELGKVEASLKHFGRSPNPLISEVNTYLFQKSGKRIRPALLILCSKLAGYQGSEHVFWSALIEVIHTASLVHDDIIDNSAMRRGQDTVHAKWGPNITVLLGDFLYIQSIALALKRKNYQIIDIIAEATSQMIEGELLEYYMSGRPDITESLYLKILDKKTASLFSASCQIGGMLGDPSPAYTGKLREFGRYLGLSFQIIDDLLDFAGDEATLGKPVLSDLREGRITLPLIYTLGRASSGDRAELARVIQNRKLEKDFVQKVLGLVSANGALDYAYDQAASYSQKAKDLLVEFPKTDFQEALTLMADFVLQRKK
jgi:octaprenyl-diphosphate synthase